MPSTIGHRSRSHFPDFERPDAISGTGYPKDITASAPNPLRHFHYFQNLYPGRTATGGMGAPLTIPLFYAGQIAMGGTGAPLTCLARWEAPLLSAPTASHRHSSKALTCCCWKYLSYSHDLEATKRGVKGASVSLVTREVVP